MKDYDARALRVARVVQERAQPEFAILFGSRARGDHDELTSDIDVMLVLDAEPGGGRAAGRRPGGAAGGAGGLRAGGAGSVDLADGGGFPAQPAVH